MKRRNELFVTNGQLGRAQMTPHEAGESIHRYLKEHGVSLEYVLVSKDGEIQFKMPTGFKIIIRPHDSKNEVILC